MQFSTQSVPESQRSDSLRAALGNVLGADIGIAPAPHGGGDMRARLQRFACGPLEFIEITGGGYFAARRGPGRPGWISVMVQLEGAALARHGRRHEQLLAGDICVMPPTGTLVVERPRHFHQVLVEVPRPMLDQTCPAWPAFVLDPIAATRAEARCLADMLRLLLLHNEALGNSGRDGLSNAVLGLLAQVMTGRDGGGASAAAGPGRRAAPDSGRLGELHRQRVQHHVLEHLRDGELSVGSVAEALKFSPRYLHKLFEGQGTTLMRWVQAQRLEACRTELHSRGERTIADIAYSWGFNHPAHFSRAYRRQFGVAPSYT